MHVQKGRPKLHLERVFLCIWSFPMCNLERPFCTCQTPGLSLLSLAHGLWPLHSLAGSRAHSRPSPLGWVVLGPGVLPGAACCGGAPRAREAFGPRAATRRRFASRLSAAAGGRFPLQGASVVGALRGSSMRMFSGGVPRKPQMVSLENPKWKGTLAWP